MREVDNFLRELGELTEKYGIVISGEGCDRPFLDDIKTEKNLAHTLKYDYVTRKYGAFSND